MKNQELAQIFFEIANFLALEETTFRPRAYRKAGEILETLEEKIEMLCLKLWLSLLEVILS